MGFREKSSTRLTSGLHGRRCGGRDSADALGAGAPAASRTARQLTDAAGCAGARELRQPAGAASCGVAGAVACGAGCHGCHWSCGAPPVSRGTGAPTGPMRSCAGQGWRRRGCGKICAPCMIRGSRTGKGGPSRQDLRAVYSQTAVCRAFRTHGARILPKPAHFGCMAAISCHEPALFPPEAPSGTHGAKKLPRLTAREHATAKCCHGSPPGNAPRRYLAKAERPAPHGAERPTASAWLIVKRHAMRRSTITPCAARSAFSAAKK